ncbi:MAG: Anaerobic magnesium-protoporphyrin IX monomethyl ester cyclase [Anaerolineales bacterium]|nr:Anaerobic magnesium-protoporphyrin IX monomethyl ester cyclase [Anaerolineales bacterium]
MTPYPPLGLLYLAAAARGAGHTVAVFDGTFAAGDEAFAEALGQHNPDVVCIASLVTLRPATLRLAGMARECGATVIVGGPDPTAEPEAYLEAPAVDVAVLGEGERTLVELLTVLAAGNDLANVRGIAHRDQGDVVRAPEQEPVLDLDALPWPARDLIDMAPYFALWREAHGYTSVTLSVSRGCPYGCEYCDDAVMGPHLRLRGSANVAAEMRHIEQQYAPDRFRLVDELEGLGRDWLVSLGEAMLDAGVATPYEGLKPLRLGDLPMLAEGKDVCADRNAWIPTTGPHPHAPPVLEPDALERRWTEAVLLEDEYLEDP